MTVPLPTRPSRVLVTGGAGFIGSHLVDRLLAAGHDVRILDSLDPQVHPHGRPGYLSTEAELIVGDVRDRDAVRRSLVGVDRLVHLAAAVGVGQSMYEIERYTSVNSIGCAVVLEAAVDVRDRLEKVVVASSMSIYGEGLYRCPAEGVEVAPEPRSEAQLADRRWDLGCPSCGERLEPLPTSETKPLAPTSIYAVGKRDHEEMTLAWGRAYRVPATALRFFNVYGPRQALSNPYTGVAAIFSSRLLNGRAPVVFEDGWQSRDFVHVSDITAAVQRALEPGAGDGAAINVGTGRSVSVLDVADVLARELGVPIRAEIRNEFRAGDIRHCFASIERARTLLGYEPAVAFEDGMRELAGWLAGQEAEDHVDRATAALVSRGLAG
ncbi:MAG TPA: NAD-dependent epimerase/dehydratase family protein [Gaiellaceae bacterium]|nr:NAD-dependent epimerase/dehydratase family protein [Gaiellaceae bacterium]